MKTTILIVLLAIVYSAPSPAAIMVGFTPEVLAHDASLIFVGVPQRAESRHLRGDRWVTSVQFRIDRRIKGPLSVGDFVTVMSIDWKDRTDQIDLVGAVGKKRSVLVLCTVAEHTFPETDGLYQFLPHFWNRPAFYADEPVKWIYTETGVAIRDYAEVLKRIEAQCAKEADLRNRYWKGEIVRREIKAQDGTDAMKELFAMSAVLIITIEYKDP